ncbi:hypothetical protein ACKWTF_000577 [Chironomus riparius]
MDHCHVETDSEDELPSNWEERVSANGFIHYVNVEKNQIQLNHPRTNKMKRVPVELPYNWKKTVDADNKVIYINELENRETKTDPRLAFSQEFANDKLRQRFDSSTKAVSILYGKNLTGQVALVTGASSGIGYETARSLSNFGCEIIFACRNEKVTNEKMKALEVENSRAKLNFIQVDLTNLKSCKEFCDKVKLQYQHINYLILNAGVFGLPYYLTSDGLETTFQVCHLSQFYITQQLSSLLNANSRVVIVSSESHRFASLPALPLTKEILNPPPAKYWSMLQYNNIKLCNILFAMELAKKWQSRGISVFALHPGNLVSTNLSRHWWFYKVIFAAVKSFTKNLEQAASTTIYCSIADELKGLSGLYFNNCYICQPSKLSLNENLATELWNLSHEIINEILQKT